MKIKVSPKTMLRKAREKVVLEVVPGSCGQPIMVRESMGVGLGIPMESNQILPCIKEVVGNALDCDLTRSEARDIFEYMQGELLTSPKRTLSVLPRVGLGVDGPEMLLNRNKGKVVQYSEGEYRIVQGGTATFIHSDNADNHPKPIQLKNIRRGIKLFRRITRLPKEECMLLILWILHAYLPQGPYLMLIIQGESGSGKTVLTEIVRLLVDPAKVLTRGCPANEKELFSAAQKNHIIAIDNASSISPKIYDALCRISTGGGVSVPKGNRLVDATEYGACRPVIINSTEPVGLRNDFLQRAIVIRLPRVTGHMSPSRLMERFGEARPKILGALLQAVAQGLNCIQDVELEGPFRMAGFLEWSVAAGGAFGWTEDAIQAVYAKNQTDAFTMLGESQATLIVIRELIRREGEWHKPAGELLKRVKEIAIQGSLRDEIDVKSIPKQPNTLSELLDGSREALLAFGIKFERGRAGGGTRLIHLTKIPKIDSESTD